MQKRQLTPSSGSLSTKSSKTRCGILPDAELRYVRNFAGAEFGKKVNLTALLRTITTTRIAGGLLLGYNPKYTCPGLKSFALHFVQVTIAM